MHVTALATAADHRFSKQPVDRLTLLAGLGVAGDAHCGASVKHRSRVAKDPSQPNLRQVHLIDEAFVADRAAQGFALPVGAIGENIRVDGLTLIDLPTGAQLRIGDRALLTITGLRNPCIQLNRYADGLMHACLGEHPDGSLKRLAGVMAVVTLGGEISVGDAVHLSLPPAPLVGLGPV
jgi:MOSC domain-containing protein YiiM